MADDRREQQLRDAMYFCYNVRRDEDLPAAFLRMMTKRPLVTQLAKRRIKFINLVSVVERDELEERLPKHERVKWLACLESIPNIEGFAVKILQGRTMKHMAFSVGHELGHTFFMNIAHPRLIRLANVSCRPPINFEEAVCNAFAQLWLDWCPETYAELMAGIARLQAEPSHAWNITLP